MTKVVLMIGMPIGDAPEYYVAETAKAEKILNPDNTNIGNWPEACEYVGEHEDVFEPFSSAVEALNYCKENDLEVEYEFDFVVY